MERSSKTDQGSLLEGKPASDPGQEPKTKKTDKPTTEVSVTKPEKNAISGTGDGQTLTPMQEVQANVVKYASRILNKERATEFATRVALIARENPKLNLAIRNNPDSFLVAFMASATLDLMPNTPEGLAYIIPYGDQVQFQTGYKGLLKLARRSGEIKTISAELVFEGDEFDVEYGTERKIVHKPKLDIDRTDYKKVTHAYATSRLVNGEDIFTVMTKKELDKVQHTAKAKSTDAPWHTWPERMALKTVLKRLTQLLPSGVDATLQKAVAMDSLAEAGRLNLDKESGEFIEGEVVGLPSGVEDAISNATERDELAEIMNGLDVKQRKLAAPMVDARLKELDHEATGNRA